MNKTKNYLIVVLCVLCGAAAFSYNPPPQGERLEQFFMPGLFSGEASVAGGALSYIAPEHVTINPALVAGEQRIAIDLGYTALFSTVKSAGLDSAFSAGFMLPTRWGVASFNAQGIFSQLEKIKFGNLAIIRAAFARDITDNLYVGSSITGGFGSDWALFANLGFMYRIGDVGFLRNLRTGVSLNGLGKTFNGVTHNSVGINSSKVAEFYPGFVTLRSGVAATLFTVGKFSGGASWDLSFPTFQNIISDLALQFNFADIVTLHTNWNVNMRELIEGKGSLVPAVGLSVKFGINTGSKEFFSKNGWQRSDIVTSAAYASLNDDIHVVSASGSIFLGLKDTIAPEIKLWVEEPAVETSKESK